MVAQQSSTSGGGRRKKLVRRSDSTRKPGPAVGSHVTVNFGSHEVGGVVLGQTVTGRYSVKVDVPGTDDSLTTTYAPEELSSAS